MAARLNGAEGQAQGERPKAEDQRIETQGDRPKGEVLSEGQSSEVEGTRAAGRTGKTRRLSSFVLKNLIVWVLMVVVLVLVPDTLEPWLGIEIARVIGWGVAFPVWMIVVERDWQTRFGPHDARRAAGATVDRRRITGHLDQRASRNKSLLKSTSSRAIERVVSGDVFAALEIPVLAGRTFDARDDASASLRAVVSANFARAAFSGLPLDAVIGQRIRAGGRSLEIIGVVDDVTLDVYGAPTLTVYHAHRQFADDRNWALSQVVATERPSVHILEDVRAAIAAMDPELVVHRAAPMTEVVGRGTRRERFALVLMGAFAGVSLMLAAIGLYGILAYAVRQRTQEIGIRMALGATAAQMRLMVVRQASFVLGTGLLAGTVGALVLGRWLTSLAFEISPSDPRIFLAAAGLLTIAGLLAAWLPARRASLVAPRIAMQEA